jgi:hypothetical protein
MKLAHKMQFARNGWRADYLSARDTHYQWILVIPQKVSIFWFVIIAGYGTRLSIALSNLSTYCFNEFT